MHVAEKEHFPVPFPKYPLSPDTVISRVDTQLDRRPSHTSGAPNVNFWKISVRKTIWDVEFSEHLL